MAATEACQMLSYFKRADGARSDSGARSNSAAMSDWHLAQRAAGGDLQAFEEIYNLHNRRVYGICLRMTGNVAEAEDLTQDAFIQLYRHIGSFRGEAAFKSWLHRLAVNQVLMHFRKRRVKVERLMSDLETATQVVIGTENPRSMQVIDRISLDTAIAQLPIGYRTVFVLHDIEGREHSEIAKILGCAEGTSKSQLHKARMKLRKLLSR